MIRFSRYFSPGSAVAVNVHAQTFSSIAARNWADVPGAGASRQHAARAGAGEHWRASPADLGAGDRSLVISEMNSIEAGVAAEEGDVAATANMAGYGITHSLAPIFIMPGAEDEAVRSK